MTALSEYRLDSPQFYATYPIDVYRQLRAESPVHWYTHGGLGFWVVSKHADVVAICRNPEAFSSGRGVSIDEIANPGRFGARDLPQGELLLMTDPPRHRGLRKVLAHHFTHAAVAGFADGIRVIARRNLDHAAELGESNFSQTVSVPTAIQTICMALDLPESDWGYLRGLSGRTTHGFDSTEGNVFGTTPDSFHALRDYFIAALEDRRAHPRGPQDWLTTLTRASANDEPLPLDTQLLYCIDLLVAGHETTDPLLTTGALGLTQYPDQRRLLQERPELMRDAVEELLRWVTPVIGMARTVTQDTELRGQELREGDYLWMLHAAANRDEEVWGDDADSIDVTRPGLGRHIALGTGIHVCIGAHLARLEAQVVFSELLDRYPNYEVTGNPVRHPSTMLNAFSDLPITLV
jgi:cytochrome P450